MRVNADQLKHLIREILYRASAPKRYGLPDVEVDAKNTTDAGYIASDKFRAQGAVVDPFSIDVQETSPTQSRQYKQQRITDETRDEILEIIYDYMSGEKPDITDDLLKHMSADEAEKIIDHATTIAHHWEDGIDPTRQGAEDLVENYRYFDRLLGDIFGGEWRVE